MCGTVDSWKTRPRLLSWPWFLVCQTMIFFADSPRKQWSIPWDPMLNHHLFGAFPHGEPPRVPRVRPSATASSRSYRTWSVRPVSMPPWRRQWSGATTLLVLVASMCFFTWVCLKIGYIPNYSHLIGIMIINHWVWYTIFRHTHRIILWFVVLNMFYFSIIYGRILPID